MFSEAFVLFIAALFAMSILAMIAMARTRKRENKEIKEGIPMVFDNEEAGNLRGANDEQTEILRLAVSQIEAEERVVVVDEVIPGEDEKPCILAPAPRVVTPLQNKKYDPPVTISRPSHNSGSNYQPGYELKEYATGVFPSLAEVMKESKRNSYSYGGYYGGYGGGYGVWDRNGYQGGKNQENDWARRFDRDDDADPYAHLYGDFYP